MAKSLLPYRKRIVEYCARVGILVPKNFDATTSAEKYVIVDESVDPPVLYRHSSSNKKEVAAFLARPENLGRSLRVLDFKRCRELVVRSDGRFIRGPCIDCISREEARKAAFMTPGKSSELKTDLRAEEPGDSGSDAASTRD